MIPDIDLARKRKKENEAKEKELEDNRIFEKDVERFNEIKETIIQVFYNGYIRSINVDILKGKESRHLLLYYDIDKYMKDLYKYQAQESQVLYVMNEISQRLRKEYEHAGYTVKIERSHDSDNPPNYCDSIFITF